MFNSPEQLKQLKLDDERTRLLKYQENKNVNELAQSNPVAYRAYVNNLEKMDRQNSKIDAYTNQMLKAKEKMFQDQKNVNDMQRLNKLNVQFFPHFLISFFFVPT